MDFERFINDNQESIKSLLLELCQIPAPSHQEEKRAKYCKNILESFGAKGVFIDDAFNVIFPLNCKNSNEITVFAAHTDTVFPDSEPMPMREENGILYCPAVGDDTASVVILMMLAKFCIENGIAPQKGIMFVLNSCEEGLGNLKGTKKLFDTYNGRIKDFVSLDTTRLNHGYNTCVGSHRYKVTAKTEGGHSFSKFGNKNAVAELAGIINDIYSITVPVRNDSKTTYNVGIISGGTSINTIPQIAEMLCEYRSDNKECLEIMKNEFEKIFKNHSNDKVEIQVEKIGDRPCGTDTAKENTAYLCERYNESVKKIINMEAEFFSASTDCNIPMSLGIPAIAIGVFNGNGAHTREEYVELNSLPKGLNIALEFLSRLQES